MTNEERETLLATLRARFETHMRRHPAAEWSFIERRLIANPAALRSVQEMESTGGEPDVVASGTTEGITFCDCSAESPAGRRSLCYDRAALDARKERKPARSAVEMATTMSVDLLDERQYRALQQLGDFDTKTSSWVRTPDEVRRLGGALFCDKRYGRVFLYHNGAESHYAARGFRASLRV